MVHPGTSSSDCVIYLRFMTDGRSIESRLIRFGTRWWCSHVEFVRICEHGNAIDTLGSRLEGGVRIRPYDYCKPSREEWWTAPNIDRAYLAAGAFIGARYDWYDILGFACARDWHRDGHFMCSETIAKAFENVSTPLLNPWQPVWRISPRDLMLSPLLQMVKRVI